MLLFLLNDRIVNEDTKIIRARLLTLILATNLIRERTSLSSLGDVIHRYVTKVRSLLDERGYRARKMKLCQKDGANTAQHLILLIFPKHNNILVQNGVIKERVK